MSLCPCGSGRSHAECCLPIIRGERMAQTPEALRRARYSAFCNQEVAFLTTSLHPDHRHAHDAAASRRWAAPAACSGAARQFDSAGGRA